MKNYLLIIYAIIIKIRNCMSQIGYQEGQSAKWYCHELPKEDTLCSTHIEIQCVALSNVGDM